MTADAPSPQAGTLTVEQALQQAIAHHQAGRLQDAERLYRAILHTRPGHADANHNLGVLAVQVNNPVAGLPHFKLALEANPKQGRFWVSYLDALIQAGQAEAAGQLLERARQRGLEGEAVDALAARLTGGQRLDTNPVPGDAGLESQQLPANPVGAGAKSKAARRTKPSRTLTSNKARAPGFQELKALSVLFGEGRLEEAAAAAHAMTERFPLHGFGWKVLGAVFGQTGRNAEALAALQQAAALSPHDPEAHNNLGLAFRDGGRLAEAGASFRHALGIKPDYAEAYNNLGVALNAQGRMDDAMASLRRAIERKPDYADAHNNLGIAQTDTGQLDQAESSFRKALEIVPGYARAHSNLLFCRNYQPHLPAQALFAEHIQWDVRQAAACPRIARPDNDPDPRRRLRVGYVSPDLRQHSVAYFFEPLLREHNREVVEVFCYAEVTRADEVTARLRGMADQWLGTVGMTDAALSQRIVDDRIDLLVDLAGHSAHNRLLVFARKPAPIQLTWLGYPHSTGLRAMDYRIVDAVTDPEGEADTLASESLLRMDDGFLCYDPPADAPSPAAAPCLASGGITFGSFNNPAKLSSATVDLWAGLLNRIPGSRLLVKGAMFAHAGSRTDFLARFRTHGVDVDRVTLLGKVPSLAGHLAVYEQVDIALDPFPYNGTTTSCEAMWMGVPVITLLGDRHAGRVGASLLTRIGLTELIAASAEAYVDIAAALANDVPRLSELRRTLRARMAASPLCAAPAFAQKMEALYRGIWERYCAGADQQ